MKYFKLLFISMLCLFSITSFAQQKEQRMHGSGYGDGQHTGGMQMRWLEKLNLTKDQLAKINKIKTEFKPIITELNQNLIAKKAELKVLFKSSTSDDKIVGVQKEIQEIEKKIADTKREILLKIRELLTPEQREQFINMMK